MHIGEMLITIVYFLVILGVMVLVHEFGHFAAAKLFGVRVEAFSIGMGKRLFGYVHNGTDYKVCALPIGGYVKMTGETEMEMIQTSPSESLDPNSPDGALHSARSGEDTGNFNAKPRWQRMVIALAGPIANFILAIFVFTLVAHFHHETIEFLQDRGELDYVVANSPAAKTGIQVGDQIVRFDGITNPTWQDVMMFSGLKAGQTLPFSYIHNGNRVDTELPVNYNGKPEDFGPDDVSTVLGLVPRPQAGPVVINDLPDSTTPAAQAGLQKGDEIVAIDGHNFHGTEATSAYLNDVGGRAVTLTIDRRGETLQVPITPRLTPGAKGTQAYKLGFAVIPPPVVTTKQPMNVAIKTGWKDFTKNSTLVFDVLGGMFKRQVSVRNLSGPVGIAQQVGMAREMGTWTVLSLAAAISLNLGIFNLLPMPILDGGMILFLIIESIIRRDVNAQLKERIYQAAFVCIILFAMFVIFNDITKLSIFSHKG
ncbi:RIP metalloprotease RseP [Terriglobus sp. TAA 43]|uniref:RIP metalloprotease RseP n=1 Tax=Terriglobus sp. TAA 43 TaxID=278961 RepID=UPI001E4FE3FF|nr:RIP metalloprotease RseP [Terriglobus sp. TAA 43]